MQWREKVSFRERCCVYIIIYGLFSILAGVSLTYSARLDTLPNIIKLVGLYKTRCSLESQIYKYDLGNSSRVKNVTEIRFNSSITILPKVPTIFNDMPRSIHNTTITIPGHLDYMLNTDSELETKFWRPDLLISIYNNLYNRTKFDCLSMPESTRVYGLWGANELSESIILAIFGLTGIAMLCLGFIGMCWYEFCYSSITLD